MDTINVNGETYTKVPDEISLFGRTYRLVEDAIPEPLDAGKGDLLEENSNGAIIYTRSLFPLVEQGYEKWRYRNNAHIIERSVAEA